MDPRLSGEEEKVCGLLVLFFCGFARFLIFFFKCGESSR